MFKQQVTTTIVLLVALANLAIASNDNERGQYYPSNSDRLYPQLPNTYIPGYTDGHNNVAPSYPAYPGDQQTSGNNPTTAGRSFRVTLMRGNIDSDEPFMRPTAYYASIGFGTPPKRMNIQFDTGTAESWVPHYTWNPFASNLHYSNGYRGSDSSTSTKVDVKFEFVHKGVTMEAKPYIDNLLFDYKANEQFPEQQLTNATAGSGIHERELADTMSNDLVQQFRFLAVSDASESWFKGAPFDGVIGLAPMERSPTGTTQFLVRARETGAISHAVFAIYINRVLDSTFGGEITFGGVNPARYSGPFYFHPVNSWFDWSLRMQNVQLGQQIISCHQGCAAVFDTGLNDIIWGPHADVVTMMNDYLNAQWDQTLQLYKVHCSRIASLPPLVFVIDGIPYSLLATNYVRLAKSQSRGEICYLTIRPRETPNWILGTNFLGAYYTVFDMDQRRIGLATMRV